jgi:hypothetical protein
MKIHVVKIRDILVLEYEYKIAGHKLYTYSKNTLPEPDLAQWDEKISELLEGKYPHHTIGKIRNTNSAYSGCDILVKTGE